MEVVQAIYDHFGDSINFLLVALGCAALVAAVNRH
jgi:hypothetical protein